MTANYGAFPDFIAFFGNSTHYHRPFMSEVLYLHQIFTDCVSNQYLMKLISTCHSAYMKVKDLNFISNTPNDKFKQLKAQII